MKRRTQAVVPAVTIPGLLVKTVFYAYLQNVFSGRKMETLLKRDVNFMWLSGMQAPDFNTINLSRKNRLADVIDDLFTQVVQLLVDGQLVSLEAQRLRHVHPPSGYL
ncbi:MAG TPA: transposase [Bacteroidales bacterium]|nr:transposase [Bacteroidales bacterium]HPL84438.1 transposase [Bacteroidales bacterium]